jgi:hypothetical protein
MHVIFHRDGSVFFQFSYFGERPGIVSSAGGTTIEDRSIFNLGADGRSAPCLVKYSHHPDGRAHFNNDGRATSAVRCQAFPLSEEGIFFQLLAPFPTVFKSVTAASRSKKRPYIPFPCGGGLPETFGLVANWWSIKTLRRFQRSANRVFGPANDFIKPNGERFFAYFLGPTTPSPQHFLVVSGGTDETPAGATGPMLVFLGGMASGSVVPQLQFIYPDESPEENAKRLGSIAIEPLR